MIPQRTGTADSTKQPDSIRAIPNSARARGIACIGAPGVGKSRLFGRRLVWDSFLLAQSQVVIDPIGATIDNFLDVVVRHLPYLTKDAGEPDRDRIVYADMSAKNGSVVPFPLYYRLGTERSLWEISERFLQVIKKSDPSLVTRPIMGWPPMHKIGVYLGMILAALGFQITEAESLLHWMAVRTCGNPCSSVQKPGIPQSNGQCHISVMSTRTFAPLSGRGSPILCWKRSLRFP